MAIRDEEMRAVYRRLIAVNRSSMGENGAGGPTAICPAGPADGSTRFPPDASGIDVPPMGATAM